MLVNPQTSQYESAAERQVQTILTENAGWKDKYKGLASHLESNNAVTKKKALNTFMAMANQQTYIENLIRNKQLESTFSGSLGQLIPKLMDVVRVFYPNLISADLFDVQVMDRMNGEVFVMHPKFSNTAAGVTAGTDVFANATDGTYASETSTLVLGSANGTTTTFSGTLAPLPARKGSVEILGGGTVVRDDGRGNLVGTGVTGRVDYVTGAVSVTFTAAPAAGVAIASAHNYDSEQNTGLMRKLHIEMSTIPLTAKTHPLGISWSTTAQLAASAHLDIDVPDTLANLAGSFIKQERDIKSVQGILARATYDPNLDFDATPSAGYSKLAKYAEIGLKLNYAESQIQREMGRGGVSWVLCGTNAADIWRNAEGFEASEVVAPIGPHKIGTLRDGTVSIFKVPSMNPDEYAVGFKGYVAGDAAGILGEWIPLYASPVFQGPDLNNHQGLMSLYDIVWNQTKYYRKGRVIANSYKG